MEHLTIEVLARLVDEPPRAEESEHLAECQGCASELEALRAQTRALASLPEIRPPLGDWESLEARLRSDGLIEDPSLLSLLTMAKTPGWMRAAAAAALFLGGSMFGATLTPGGGPDAMASGTAQPARFAAADDLGAAAAAVRDAEANYVNALTRLRQLQEQQGGSDQLGDPITSLAALEYLVAAGQAAVRQAPANPFLNGLLASTLAERDAVLHRVSSRRDNWF
jgi:hypothetical protein